MNFDYNKCPDCGYTNTNQPNICPCCGYNLDVYRRKLSEIEKRKQEEEKKKQEEEKRNLLINGTFVKDGNTIYFGTYPQTDVTKTMSSVLSSYISLKPTTNNSNGWTSYKFYIEESNENDFMWYKDITHTDGNKYRAVYFTKNIPNKYSSSTSSSDRDDNGYFINTIYWFKYEPVKWNILSESNGKALIVSELIIDSQNYNYTKDSRTGATDYQGNATISTISGSNYQYSTIRAWLNETFHNTCFNEYQKAIIEITNVDNSASSTGDSTNPYACSNTNDKIFLLSYKEVTTYYVSNSSRQAKTTEYAKCQGAYTYTSSPYSGNGSFWLRSPRAAYDSYSAFNVSYSGIKFDDFVYYTNIGVRAACYIKLQ